MDAPLETLRQESSFTSPLAPGVSFHRIAIHPHDASNTRARLLVVHGYGDHAGRYVEFMQWLAARGVACHAFDLRGHGRSSGARVFVRRWDEYLDDLRAMLAQEDLASPAHAPLFILGHSHGGLVVAVAVERGLIPAPAGCILTAPFFVNCHPIAPAVRAAAGLLNVLWPSVRVRSGVKTRMTSRDPEMAEASRRDPLLIRCATPRWYFGHRKAQAEALANAARFTPPLLIVQGDADPIADPRGAAAFHAAAASADKTLISCPGFVHEPLRELGRERVYADVLAWIAQRAR